MDRHVRPGWIYSAYRSFSKSPSATEQALVGKKDTTYRLQILRVQMVQQQGFGGHPFIEGHGVFGQRLH